MKSEAMNWRAKPDQAFVTFGRKVILNEQIKQYVFDFIFF